MIILYPKVTFDDESYSFTDGGRVLDESSQEEKDAITKKWCKESIDNAEEIYSKLSSNYKDINTSLMDRARSMLMALSLASVPPMEDPITYLTGHFNKWMKIWVDTFEKKWKLDILNELREYGYIYLKHKTLDDGADMEDELKTLFEVKGRLLGLALSNPRDITTQESPFEYSAIEFNNIFEWLEDQMRDYLVAKLIRDCNGAYEEGY